MLPLQLSFVQRLFLNILVQQINNIFINSYLFLLALLYDSIFIHHPQGLSYYVY